MPTGSPKPAQRSPADPNDHREAISDTNLRQRLGSVGKALPSIELEIRDEDGQAVSAGTPGEIYVRGPQVSGEYDGRSVLDSEGWFPTRDAGYLDDGAIFSSLDGQTTLLSAAEKTSPPGKSKTCYWTGTMSWTRLPLAWHPRSGEKRLP